MEEKTEAIKEEEELTDYQREQGYDPEEKTFRTGGWGHSEDPTTPSPYDHLLDLAGDVSVMASKVDNPLRGQLKYLQGQLELIASKLKD